MSTNQANRVLRHLRQLVTAQSTEHLPDRQLLQQFVTEGDQAAFAALMQRHGPLVLGVCRSVLHHHQDAEDAFQATFLVLARKAGSIRRQTAVSSWLYGVASRLARKAKAGAARRRLRE